MGVRYFAPVHTGPGAHPASCTMGTGFLPGVKSGRGVMLIPHLLLVPLVMKEQSYASTPPMGRTACTEPQCLYKGALYLTVELYLYSPYGPYGLYRASVPIQGCTLFLFIFFNIIYVVHHRFLDFTILTTGEGHAVAQLVEELRYKPEGRGVDSR